MISESSRNLLFRLSRLQYCENKWGSRYWVDPTNKHAYTFNQCLVMASSHVSSLPIEKTNYRFRSDLLASIARLDRTPSFTGVSYIIWRIKSVISQMLFFGFFSSRQCARDQLVYLTALQVRAYLRPIQQRVRSEEPACMLVRVEDQLFHVKWGQDQGNITWIEIGPPEAEKGDTLRVLWDPHQSVYTVHIESRSLRPEPVIPLHYLEGLATVFPSLLGQESAAALSSVLEPYFPSSFRDFLFEESLPAPLTVRDMVPSLLDGYAKVLRDQMSLAVLLTCMNRCISTLWSLFPDFDYFIFRQEGIEITLEKKQNNLLINFQDLHIKQTRTITLQICEKVWTCTDESTTPDKPIPTALILALQEWGNETISWSESRFG